MGAERGRSVLLTADTVGGVWTYAVELARGLARHGWRVHLASMGAPVAPHQRAQLQGIDGLSLHDSRWRLEWMREPWADVDAAGRWLLQLERELQPDVVHLNQFAFGALPFAAPTLLVAHSCVLSWWRAVHGVAAPPDWNAYRERVAAGLHGAGQVGAPTGAMLETLASNYGFHAPGLVLPNGLDTARFAPAAKQPFVLAAGRFWDEAKNLSALDAAAQHLAWPVHVAGSCAGPDGALRQPQHVHTLGELPNAELARQMANAAIYALPARYEPFGLSVLEAALSGCALVLGDIASLREVWGEAACYVPPGDPKALRAALEALMAAPLEREHRARAAHERALHFSAERMTAAVLSAYHGLLQQAAPLPQEELSCA